MFFDDLFDRGAQPRSFCPLLRARRRGSRRRQREARDRDRRPRLPLPHQPRSEEHTSELQSLMRNSYAVFCLKKKTILNSTYTYSSISTNHVYTLFELHDL